MKAQTNNHPVKTHPTIGACGLDCGLCPSYHRDTNRLPGCCGEASGTRMPGCGFITCCVKQRGLDTCGQCNEFEFCPRVMKHLEQAKHADSVLSYHPVAANFEFVRKNGIAKWSARENEKIAFLKILLADYNDGRSKTFYCLSVQLLPLDRLKPALAQAQKKVTAKMTPKEKTLLVREAFGGWRRRWGWS